MDHSASSPLPNDDSVMGENLDGEVYGLSDLCWSQQIAVCVKRIGQQRWGSNSRAHFVNNREESNEEDEDIEDDSDFDHDLASDEGIEGYEDEGDEMFAGPGQEGVSLWDSLGGRFFKRGISIRGKASG